MLELVYRQKGNAMLWLFTMEPYHDNSEALAWLDGTYEEAIEQARRLYREHGLPKSERDDTSISVHELRPDGTVVNQLDIGVRFMGPGRGFGYQEVGREVAL